MDPRHPVWATPELRDAVARQQYGRVVRILRQAEGLTLAELGARCGYSGSRLSRLERDLAPLTDVGLLRTFARALNVPPAAFGLLPVGGEPADGGKGLQGTPGPTVVPGTVEAEEGPVRRRVLLANLVVTAAASAVPAGWPNSAASASSDARTQLLDVMRGMLLGTAVPTGAIPGTPHQVDAMLADATRAFHACQYQKLGIRLPRLVAGAQDVAGERGHPASHAAVAHGYNLASRLLVKLDEPELGLMAADRAQTFAAASGDGVLAGEAARNMSVLTRKLGWHGQATDLAVQAANQLRATDPRSKAQRGLLLMSAGYTAAKQHDAAGLKDYTAQAERIAGTLSDRILLPTHGGGFGGPVVALHLISGHNAVGDPAAALAVAHKIKLDTLPTTERRARYLTDVATSYGMWGKREECLDKLLQAERIAPQEICARPAVRNLVNGMLASGRTSRELRGFAARLHLA